MRILSLFSGIGAPESALKRMNIDYELVGFSEIDKFAARSYCSIHGVDASKNLGDITKIDEKSLPKNIDLITYGFPCQDLSVAGKMKGLFNENGERTRSGLFFDALRVISETKPKVAIAENVKALTSKKFKNEFSAILEALDEAGYNNYWSVLNATDFNVPQKRERIFIVSIRKELDSGKFIFPEGIGLHKSLLDISEKNVPESFYLPDAQIKRYGDKERL